MKNFKLKISSKNKKATNYFYKHLFERKNIKHNYKKLLINKSFVEKTRRISLLKAPHVYKASQEQFEYKFFLKKFELLITNYRKFLVFLKAVQTNRFFETNVQITMEIQKFCNIFFKKNLKKNFIFLNIFNFCVKNQNNLIVFLKETMLKLEEDNDEIKRKWIKKEKEIKLFSDTKTNVCHKYLKIFDILGENFLIQKIKNSLNSSVGRAKD